MMLERTTNESLQSEVMSWFSDVKRIRIGQFGGRLLLSLNEPAARDLTSTRGFEALSSYLNSTGQELVYLRSKEMSELFLRPQEMVDGLFGEKQILLEPKVLENGEQGPNWTDAQIFDFAKKCVRGEIISDWAVPETEAAQRGVIVCDNRRVLPDNQFDTGPGNCDVIAASISSYEPLTNGR